MTNPVRVAAEAIAENSSDGRCQIGQKSRHGKIQYLLRPYSLGQLL